MCDKRLVFGVIEGGGDHCRVLPEAVDIGVPFRRDKSNDTDMQEAIICNDILCNEPSFLKVWVRDGPCNSENWH
jgi:hypothetical protein